MEGVATKFRVKVANTLSLATKTLTSFSKNWEHLLMEMKSVAARNDKVSDNNYIPNDISFSILSKLPLKSLKRFECVQKSWSLLFQNHHFMKMFRNNLLLSSQHCSYYDGASLLLNDIGNGFYSLYGDKFENKVKLDSPFRNHDSAHILGFGSINGLYFVIENGNYNRLILWNPATPAAVKVIPSSMVFESLDLSDDDFGMFYTSNYLNGFGYDDITDDYKVIQYVSVTGELVGIRDMSVEVLGYESLCSFWEIYSLRSNTWRKLEAEMPPSLDSFEGSQVYMDGVCHWFCGQDSPDGQCVVSFYLNSEEFFITPIPSDDDYFVERPIGVGTKGEIFFVRKDEELLWLDIGSQMIVELGYKVDPYSSRITIYKESILPLEGIRDLFFVY